MPPIGFHGLLALFIARNNRIKDYYFIWGLMVFSVIPDLDLIGSMVIYLLTWNVESTISFHRSVTHSLLLISILIGINICLYLITNSKNTENLTKFLNGSIIGLVLHITLDFFYLDGVSIFWPFIQERIKILPITINDFPESLNFLTAKIIATIDGEIDFLFYLAMVKYAKNSDNSLNFDFHLFNLRIDRWKEKLTWYSYLLIVEMIFFIILAFLSIPIVFMDLEVFIILLYAPMIPTILLSCLLPLILKSQLLFIINN